jgi:hypothetical protein
MKVVKTDKGHLPIGKITFIEPTHSEKLCIHKGSIFCDEKWGIRFHVGRFTKHDRTFYKEGERDAYYRRLLDEWNK